MAQCTAWLFEGLISTTRKNNDDPLLAHDRQCELLCHGVMNKTANETPQSVTNRVS